MTGTGFLAGATVSLGGTAATSDGGNSTSITATTAAHAAGAVNVVVTNSDSQNGTLTNGYTYTTSTGGAINFVQVDRPRRRHSSPVSVALSVGADGREPEPRGGGMERHDLDGEFGERQSREHIHAGEDRRRARDCGRRSTTRTSLGAATR